MSMANPGADLRELGYCVLARPRALASIRYLRRWYADGSREVNAVPRAAWESVTEAQRTLMRFRIEGPARPTAVLAR
jgi:hypothetical protein